MAEAANDLSTITMGSFGYPDSIDSAVMEKNSRGAAVPANAAWSGVGSWRALAHQADANRQHHRRHRHQKLPPGRPELPGRRHRPRRRCDDYDVQYHGFAHSSH